MDIELRHIHKRFGRIHANNDINITFAEGRIVGVLGENGAGKSTLMKILSGYQPADSGEILIDGKVVDYSGPQAAIAQGIGMLQQDPLDIGAFSVLENFTYGQPGGLFQRRKRSTDHRQRLGQYAERFGFELPPEMPVAQLSIAQRQQLEIVRLLALDVRALILDEPTTGISAEQKQRLFAALQELAQNDGLIVLLVSHKLEDVIALCDEVLVLRDGRLVGQREMPATTGELVGMMFGGELASNEPPAIPPGNTIMALENVLLKDKRLYMPNINFEIRTGEVVGLAGLEGSGQQLFMRALVGLERTYSGRVLLASEDLSGKTYREHMQRNIVYGAAGRLEEGLIAGLTLTEHMALVMDNHATIDWRLAQSRMLSRVRQYDVRGAPSDRIEQLSGGNQQRVLMTLLPEKPAVMVLEQPTRGLDVESARWIWQQLLARRERGTAIVFGSPELDELVTYSDRIVVFYAGRLHIITDVSSVTIDELGHLIGGAFLDEKTSV